MIINYIWEVVGTSKLHDILMKGRFPCTLMLTFTVLQLQRARVMLNGLDQGYDFSFGGRLMGWKLGVYLCVYIRPLCNEIKDGQKSLLLTLQVLLYTGYFSLHVFSLLNKFVLCVYSRKRKKQFAQSWICPLMIGVKGAEIKWGWVPYVISLFTVLSTSYRSSQKNYPYNWQPENRCC